MAPSLKNLEEDEDFVLTISDNDDAFALEEDGEISSLTIPPTPKTNGRKRKHDIVNEQISIDDVHNGVNKMSAKSNKKRKVNGAPVANGNKTREDEYETWTAGGEDDGAMDSDFEFQVGDVDLGTVEDFDGWDLSEKTTAAKSTKTGDKRGVDIDELIARRRKGGVGATTPDGIEHMGEEDLEDAEISLSEGEDSEGGGLNLEDEEHEDETLAEDAFGMGVSVPSEEEEGVSSEDDEALQQSSDDEAIADDMPDPEDLDQDISSTDEMDDLTERAKREAFFAPEDKVISSNANIKGLGSFQSMSLSRPILRGLAAVGFSEPTPIQTKTIPVALLGKDVVGGAVTGSGKTAAFIIPIIERLLYRPKKVPTSRVAILMPTRELAVQCFNVAQKLASVTDIAFCQLVGGFSLREQEAVLRGRPDVIIATPGRFIDHMRNSASFTVDTLEILVLDEADRMLEDGFADELNEILTTIPKSRQTMLFSATMTDRVDKLIRLGLNRPVRLMVDARKQTVGTLIQEFVRLRPGREDKRLGYLMHLCQSIYTDRTIIFFRQKKEAHRVRIIFGLLGIKAAELHGSMSQEQRIGALSSFRSGQCTHLLATDLASRGLDISNISTVINYEAPQSHEIYLHRVGRTARAGRAGRSCTIAAEPDRKIVKQAVKSGKAQGAKIVSRVVETSLADAWAAKVSALDEEVEEILKDEQEEKALAGAEMHVRKGENIITHEDEIKSRPKRTWFESEKEKVLAKKKGQAELNGAVGLGKAKAGGKLSHKDKKRLDDGRERKEGRVWK
ncbi:ATP-dependent RNA helicase DDX27, partial [Lecanoromycetidae sp. Uapishka_2]